MAHDKQYKDSPFTSIIIKEYGYPRTGDKYWNRNQHRVDVADHDMSFKCAIIERRIP